MLIAFGTKIAYTVIVMARTLENKFTRDSFATDKAALPSSVFGVLAEIASTYVKHYWSDLYWDAMQCKEMLTNVSLPEVGDTFTFYFSCGKCGTHIFEDEEHYRIARKQRSSDMFYLVTLKQLHKFEKYGLYVDWIMTDDMKA